MAVESATYVSDLVITNPLGGDSVAQGDEHLRLLKTVLKNTFAGLTGKIVTGLNGSLQLPVGTTAQRDGSPLAGMIRGNTTLNGFEGYLGGNWRDIGSGQMYGVAQTKGIFYNAQVIDEDVTVLAGTNGGSFGVVTVANGRTVTLENGTTWTMV